MNTNTNTTNRESKPRVQRRRFGGRPHGRPSAIHGARPAFTLIELLVVIAVISLLAALIFPTIKAVNKQKIKAKTSAELSQFETAIESYKAKLGHYPPDNPGFPATNQLFFELLGTALTNTAGGWSYVTLDGTAQVSTNNLGSFFGGRVGGFVNCTRGSGDESHPATVFLKGLKPSQIGDLGSGCKIFVASVPWPADPNYPIVNHPTLNPIRYNSSTPTNNPATYDLWVDVIIDGKTNRFCNWSSAPLIVGAP